MLDRLSVLCFAGTYGLALACELARVLFRGRIRWEVGIGLCGLGWLVHTAYLANLAWTRPSWQAPTVFESLLLVAWMLAAMDLYLAFRVARQSAVGAFVLPVVLSLSSLAVLAPRADWASWGGQVTFWGTVHGLFLLAGATLAALAFVGAAMYLVQEARLRNKRAASKGWILPSLEQSERINRVSITLAFPLLTLGFGSGLVLDRVLVDHATHLGWADPKVICGLLAWGAYLGLAHARYHWSMRGRRVMGLSIAAFGLLMFSLAGVDLLLPTSHGVPPQGGPG